MVNLVVYHPAKGPNIMASATVKIDPESYAKLKATAEEAGKPMIEVLAKAIDAYSRQSFLEGLNADFAALRADPKKWDEELTERSAWDAALADDLEGD
jgi:hypothetical protein